MSNILLHKVSQGPTGFLSCRIILSINFVLFFFKEMNKQVENHLGLIKKKVKWISQGLSFGLQLVRTCPSSIMVLKFYYAFDLRFCEETLMSVTFSPFSFFVFFFCSVRPSKSPFSSFFSQRTHARTLAR